MFSLFLTSRQVYFAALTLLLVGCVVACLLLSRQAAPELALSDYHIYQCDTGGAGSGKTFDILTVSSIRARKIADTLCQDPAIARHYDGVRISWKPRGQLTAEEVLNEDYDLIWSRVTTMRGLVPKFSDYYDTLLRFDHYKVFWFSRNGRPELSREYFAGKRIGLLSDKLSHTLYLLPLASLKEAGVNLAEAQLSYFDDAISLYDAFLRGEVDLVSGGLWLERDLDAPVQKALITEHATAFTLFVRKARDREVDCPVASAFISLAESLAASSREFDGVEACEA